MTQLPDPSQLERDARDGHPKAQFLLSQHCFQQGDLGQMIYWLEQADATGLRDASEALGFCHEIGRGVPQQFAPALTAYDRAIVAGSEQTKFHKAQLLYKCRDAEACDAAIRELLFSAAEAGQPRATAVINYLARDQGLSAADTSALQLFPASAADHETLSQDPVIRLYHNVLTPQDGEHLARLAQPHLQRADVIDPDGSKAGVSSQVRTSLSTFLGYAQVDFIGRYIERKLVHAVDGDLARSEPMSILCYAPGEYYQPHYDYFSPNLAVSQKHLDDGGQRLASAVTYLSQPGQGGGTSFPDLNITVPPQQGSTLWFRNCDASGQPDPRSLHSGDPVMAGQKWVVTKWFREQDSGYLLF